MQAFQMGQVTVYMYMYYLDAFYLRTWKTFKYMCNVWTVPENELIVFKSNF